VEGCCQIAKYKEKNGMQQQDTGLEEENKGHDQETGSRSIGRKYVNR
jgi:hypothetical protein